MPTAREFRATKARTRTFGGLFEEMKLSNIIVLNRRPENRLARHARHRRVTSRVLPGALLFGTLKEFLPEYCKHILTWTVAGWGSVSSAVPFARSS